MTYLEAMSRNHVMVSSHKECVRLATLRSLPRSPERKQPESLATESA